jgi:hypothetical protein
MVSFCATRAPRRTAIRLWFVDVLTHRTGESDLDYLTRCRADPDAVVIKRLDLIDKLVADDDDVPASTRAEIRGEATARLALLDQLLARTGEEQTTR